ncbi:MAG: non-canonical purine NTP pyrophosphatase [Gemmatimonadaceae bacterium]|nr:non-canonical purine NTP pyrophosphatase [Gemmatimonadaceae bacterium]
MTAWVIATRSRGKLAELVPMLAAHGISAIGLADAGLSESAAEAGIEVFDSFEANAVAKARHFAARTGQPCLADDSGLCIDALGGLPGVRSRRFARDAGWRVPVGVGEDAANAEAMLDACWNSGWAPPWAAHFACAAAFADGTRVVVTTGRSAGTIIPERAGDGGFGYDPWFMSADLGCTFAQASTAAKAQVSHRARAVAAVLAQLC